MQYKIEWEFVGKGKATNGLYGQITTRLESSYSDIHKLFVNADKVAKNRELVATGDLRKRHVVGRSRSGGFREMWFGIRRDEKHNYEFVAQGTKKPTKRQSPNGRYTVHRSIREHKKRNCSWHEGGKRHYIANPIAMIGSIKYAAELVFGMKVSKRGRGTVRFVNKNKSTLLSSNIVKAIKKKFPKPKE